MKEKRGGGIRDQFYEGDGKIESQNKDQRVEQVRRKMSG